MKIAIYETVHIDWLIPLCELFSEKPDNVSFFTSCEFENDLKEALNIQYQKFHWTYIDPNTRWKGHFNQFKSFLHQQKFDLLILNSIDARHLLIFLAVLPATVKSVLINVHDIHNFFNAGYFFGVRKNVRSIGKKLLTTLAHGYIVNTRSMREYIISKNLTSKPIYWLPPVIAKAIEPLPNSYTHLVIAIPGSIDERRRDYLLALEVFEIISRNTHLSFELILAGRPIGKYGELIIEKAISLQKKGINITYFKNEIKELAFQEIISGCHIVFSPLQSSTSIHDGITETYGVTKGSGNIYDAIRHGKPLLVPTSLIVPSEIQSSCLRYNSKSDLLHLFTRLSNGEIDYFNLLKEAYNNSQHFTRDETQKKLNAILADFVIDLG